MEEEKNGCTLANNWREVTEASTADDWNAIHPLVVSGGIPKRLVAD